MPNYFQESDIEEDWHVQYEPAPDPGTYTDSGDTDSTADTNSTIQTDDLEGQLFLLQHLTNPERRRRTDYFRMEHGRAFAGFEELPIALPTDVEEIHRLQIQHQTAELIMSGTLNPILTRYLAPRADGRRNSVLDVRTQAGLWAEQTAIRFPHVDIKTVDVTPTIPHVPRANLFHEVYDIHLGLLEPDASFDLVHARSSVNMMKDWRKMLKEIHRVLRPGGMFVFSEVEPRMTSPGERESDSLARTSRSARFFDKYRATLLKSGILADSYNDIDSWLHPGDPLWASQPGSGFRDIAHWEWETPTTGLWHPDPAMQEIGRLATMNLFKFFHNARPLFLSSGVSEQEYESWADDSLRELCDPTHVAVIRRHLFGLYMSVLLLSVLNETTCDWFRVRMYEYDPAHLIADPSTQSLTGWHRIFRTPGVRV